MTDPNYCAIMLVIDRSGSMATIRFAAQDAVNEFIHGQAGESGRRTIRIAQFDHDYETVHDSTPAARCPKFELVPRGNTALHDAMGRGITEFGEELAALPEDRRPSTVIFAVMTDGWENYSREYSRQQIRDLVERQEADYNWQVLYLGANQDAIAVGAALGVPRHQTVTYAATDHGTRAVTNSLDSYVASSVRTGRRGAFTDEDREDATAE